MNHCTPPRLANECFPQSAYAAVQLIAKRPLAASMAAGVRDANSEWSNFPAPQCSMNVLVPSRPPKALSNTLHRQTALTFSRSHLFSAYKPALSEKLFQVFGLKAYFLLRAGGKYRE